MSKLPGCFRKLLPIIAVAAFLAVAGTTDWFSETLHSQMIVQLKDFRGKLLPFALNAGLGFLVVYIAWLLYARMRDGVMRFLSHTGSTDKGRGFVILIFQVLYWSAAVFIALSIVAPDFLKNMFLSFSILSAALVLALQDGAKNMISSAQLHTMPKCSEGDFVTVVGTTDATGKVRKIGHLMTEIEVCDPKTGEPSKSGRIMFLPNSTLWTAAVIVGKPEPKEEEKKEEKEEKPCACCCCCPCKKAAQAQEAAASTTEGEHAATPAADGEHSGGDAVVSSDSDHPAPGATTDGAAGPPAAQ